MSTEMNLSTNHEWKVLRTFSEWKSVFSHFPTIRHNARVSVISENFPRRSHISIKNHL